VTISVGIASAARGDDRRTLFAAADGVLYDAKRSGRDRVVRLSGVTQTRAGGSPLDVLFGPPPAAEDTTAEASDTAPEDAPEEGAAAVTVIDVQPSPLDDGARTPADAAGGFAPLLIEPRPVDPPLGTGSPSEPLLGPVPGSGVSRCSPSRRPSSPTSSGAPAARPSRSSRWCARRGASTPTARPWCCAPAETLVALAGEHDAYTTMDAAAMAAAVGPLPEPVGRVRVLCAGGADTPVAAEAAFVARVTGTEVVRVDDVERQPDPVAARRRLAAGRRRLPGRGRRAGRLARHDDRRHDRRPGGRRADVDRAAGRARRPRRVASRC
jgi:hypothetical protein